MRRLVLRSFRAGQDTVRNELTVYDIAEQLVRFESYYRIGSRQLPREIGEVSFETAAEPEQPQSPGTARRLLAASQHMHGRYLPTTRYTYNAQGSLVRSFFIPPSILDKPKTTIKADDQGTMTLTISAIIDTSSIRYVRAPDGQLLREEYHLKNTYSPTDTPQLPQVSFTNYTYLPNGLRKTKAGSMPARYEYRYTYY